MSHLHATIPLGSNLTEKQLDDLREIFRKFDVNGDGTITKAELASAIEQVAYRRTQDADLVAMEMFSQTDENSDGTITFQEFVDAVVYKTTPSGRSTSAFRGLVRRVALAYVKKSDTKRKDYLDSYSFCPPPIFVLCITIIEIIVYAVFASRECGTHVSLECPLSFSSELAFRPGCREEVYRFITYVFVHAGVSHILFNCLLQVIVGIPLELVHGPLRVMGVYFMGGLAGSFASSVVDPNANLVGASAAVYSLVGAHVADTFLNWAEMPFRWVRAAILFLLISTDLSLSIYNRYNAENGTHVSYSGHLAGFLLGCTLGTVILKNLEGHDYERIIGYVGVALAVCGFIFGIFWNIFYDFAVDSCPRL
eukprot:m.18384 g.18384  ORF g.18384 m.18384 type:complete len:366 (-) comp8475_c1_seq1:128-1225(-)